MGTQAVPLSSLGLTAKGGGNPPIAGISVDSRQVQPGTLFAAMPGSKVHGAEFIQYALRMGAVAVLTDAKGPRWRLTRWHRPRSPLSSPMPPARRCRARQPYGTARSRRR